MQADSVVGLRRFGRKSLVEQARQVLLRNAHAIVLAEQVQPLAARLVHNLSTHAQDTLLVARIAYRLGRVDDEVL